MTKIIGHFVNEVRRFASITSGAFNVILPKLLQLFSGQLCDGAWVVEPVKGFVSCPQLVNS